jgi:hypothetical protein
MAPVCRVERTTIHVNSGSNPHTTWRADFPHHSVQALIHSAASAFIPSNEVSALVAVTGIASSIS